MARGGQGGLSFLGENSAIAAGSTLVITLLLQMQLGCFGGGSDSAEASFDDKCEAAYFAEKAGEDFDEVVLNEPLCVQHMTVELRVRAAEDQQDLQEAQTP